MPQTPPQVSNDSRARGLRAVVSSFARGIVDNVAPDQIPDDAVADALNVEFDRQRNLRTRQGCARLNWNGNLIGVSAFDFAFVWLFSSAARDAAAVDAPGSGAADLLLDSGVGLGHVFASSAEVGASESWGASCYVRVPVDVLAPPASWDGTIPCVALEFTGATAVGAGVCLVPSVTSDDGWDLAPAAGLAVPASYAKGEVVEDPGDADFQWIQVLVHKANNDSGNTTATVRLYPAYAAYTVAGGGDVVVSFDASGRVVADTTVASVVGVGFWGAVLERGRTPARRPSAGGASATIADNYLTGRVTSVFYYRTPDADAILATCGTDLLRFVPSRSWFARITGDLDFPDDTLWQWTIFDGKAYGVNRGLGERAVSSLYATGNLSDGDTVQIIGPTDDLLYTFESGTLDTPYEVLLGADLGETLDNLALAIRDVGTPGVDYAAGTAAHSDVWATRVVDADLGETVLVTAIEQGTAGSAIQVEATSSTASWTEDFLDGGSGYDNPIVLSTPGSSPRAVRGLPPAGRYITTWNGRVWIVPEAEPWTLYGSKLGDGEDWTDTDPAAGAVQIEIGYQERFDITGLHVHQGVLLVPKRDRIYAVTPGDPNTDASRLRVDLLTLGIGSISGYAIRTLLEDVVFMSAYGLAALSLVEKFGVFRENVISRDVRAFGDPEVGTERAILAVYPRKSQAIIAFAPRSGVGNTNAYVLDYRGVAQAADGVPALGFTRATGPLQAASADLADVDGVERLLLGGGQGADGLAYVWLYDEEDSFEDEGERYPVSIQTKAYSWGDVFALKRFHRWESLLELLEESIDVSVTWRPDLRRSVFQQFRRDLEGQPTPGSLWDEAVWDESIFSEEDVVSNVFISGRFSGNAAFGTHARALQAEYAPAGAETGFVLKGLSLVASWGRDVSGRGTSGTFDDDDEDAMITDEEREMETEEGDTAVHDD